MAKLKKFMTHRRLESRPNTRKSKYKGKAFNRSVPPSKIVKYNFGNLKKHDFRYIVCLKSAVDCQIRSNAMESARQVCVRHLESKIPQAEYHFQFRAYPHHIMRENPLATGAGADRLSTGMSCAFGVAIGVACRIHAGDVVVATYCDESRIDLVKKALMRSKHKLPCSCTIDVVENKSANSASN